MAASKIMGQTTYRLSQRNLALGKSGSLTRTTKNIPFRTSRDMMPKASREDLSDLTFPMADTQTENDAHVQE